MKIKLLPILSIISLTLFYGCGMMAKKQENLWFFMHYTGENKASNRGLTPASFLNLQKDGSYALDFGKFDYGQWIKKEDQLYLINATKDTTTYPIKFESTDVLQLYTEKGVVANFEAKPQTLVAVDKDPFSLVNNRWRIPADHKESQTEIKERLQYHLQFWISYFTWALDNQVELVDVRSTPTPIKIYGNGFTLKPYADLPATWKSYFFDTEDCRIANNMIHEVLQYHEIAWPQTDVKYKMFISAFQQLQAYLNEVVTT